jgi:RasGEF domain
LGAALSRIEYNLFRVIKTEEFMHLRWQKKGKEENAPNMLRLIDRFNEVSRWVATMIVKSMDVKRRVQLMSLFIQTGMSLSVSVVVARALWCCVLSCSLLSCGVAGRTLQVLQVVVMVVNLLLVFFI